MDRPGLKLVAASGYTTPMCCVCDDAGCEHCPAADLREWPEYAARMDMVNYEDEPGR